MRTVEKNIRNIGYEVEFDKGKNLYLFDPTQSIMNPNKSKSSRKSIRPAVNQTMKGVTTKMHEPLSTGKSQNNTKNACKIKYFWTNCP